MALRCQIYTKIVNKIFNLIPILFDKFFETEKSLKKILHCALHSSSDPKENSGVKTLKHFVFLFNALILINAKARIRFQVILRGKSRGESLKDYQNLGQFT